MLSIGSVILGIVYGILAAATIRTAYDAIRLRNRQQTLIFLVVGSLAAILLVTTLTTPAARPPALAATVALLTLSHPYLLLELAAAFWPVARGLMPAARLATLAGPVVLAIYSPRSLQWILFLGIYTAAVAGYAARALTLQAMRTAGVVSWRLRLAATAAWMFLLIAALTAMTPSIPAIVPYARGYIGVFGIVMVVCYSLGLATPRSLRRLWQRGAMYHYLRVTASRAPAERARKAAEDLCRAAMSSTGANATLVLMPEFNKEGFFTVAASSVPAWVNRVISPERDPFSRALAGEAVSASTLECRSGLAEDIRGIGAQVVAVPIMSARERVWGLLAIVHASGSLFPDDDLEVMTLQCGHAADALEQAWVVEERAALEQRAHSSRRAELEQSRQRLAEILEATTDFVTMSQIEGPPLYLNRAARAALGLGPDEQIPTMFDVRPPAYAAFFRDVMQPALLRDGIWIGETEYQSRSGRVIPVSQVAVAHRDAQGRVEFLSSISRDISDRRAAEAARESLESQLRQAQKMEAIGQLAGGVAHDFNNLLTAVLVNAETLQDEHVRDDQRRMLAAEIEESAKRAADLTRQLLAFGRRQVLNPRVTRLSAVIDKLLPMLRRTLGSHIKIVAAARGSEPQILADVVQVEQIVLNLAVNARDAMPGGGTLTITSGGTQIGEGWFAVLEVRDTGTGMEAATLTKIFEPFFTTKDPGRGTGLGLATVYGIVTQMHGTIDVTSSVGAGTKFTLCFPSHADEAVRADEPSPPAAGITTGGKETILLVEDEASVRELATKLLRRHGYRVLSAIGPDEAFALVESAAEPIHLILTDVRMPGGTGMDLSRRLREAGHRLPTIFMSGYGEFGPDRDIRLGDDQRFLAKPFTGADLTNAVREALDG
jgi:PAS domain S-box-containing protein